MSFSMGNKGGRPAMASSVRKGNDMNKDELKVREEAEKRLMGDIDLVKEAPATLDALAQAYYLYMVENLETSNLLSNLDIPLLTETAFCLARLEEAKATMLEVGTLAYEVDKMGNEKVKKHPIVDVYNTLLNQFKTLGGQLCMSPSARTQMASLQLQAKEDEDDPVLKALGISK